MTEIEIRDPDPQPGDPEPAEGPAADSPYRNLLVPLVVVPALIVMVLVLVFVLFGAVAGEEDSPRENLDRVLNGGFNERKQAAFNLVRQMLTYQQSIAAGEATEWSIDPAFLPDLKAAHARVGPMESPADVPVPFLLSNLLAQLGQVEGLEDLMAMTGLSDQLDPQGEYRLYAVLTLVALGPEAPEPERAAITRTLIDLLASEDAGLALAAIAGLQKLPSKDTTPALLGELPSADLARRGTAALSLAALGDPAGAEVLTEMLGLEIYATEREGDPRRWPPRQVSDSRCRALEALATLDRLPAGPELGRLAEQDPDPDLRLLATRLATERAVSDSAH